MELRLRNGGDNHNNNRFVFVPTDNGKIYVKAFNGTSREIDKNWDDEVDVNIIVDKVNKKAYTIVDGVQYGTYFDYSTEEDALQDFRLYMNGTEENSVSSVTISNWSLSMYDSNVNANDLLLELLSDNFWVDDYSFVDGNNRMFTSFEGATQINSKVHFVIKKDVTKTLDSFLAVFSKDGMLKSASMQTDTIDNSNKELTISIETEVLEKGDYCKVFFWERGTQKPELESINYEPKPIKVLALGNSFAKNSVTYLKAIAESDGVSIDVWNAYMAGRSLGGHYDAWVTPNDSNQYRIEHNGISTGKYQPLQDFVTMDDWDYVVLQGTTHYSSYDTGLNNRDDLNNVKQGDRLWGNLESYCFPYDIYNTESTVNLAEMTTAAITALANDDEGFFLMVEGSRVDGGGHGNSAQNMVSDYLAFDAAFNVALEFAKGRDDTIIVACPDHDTGGMNLTEDLDSAVALVQAGEEPESITWTTSNHTNRNGGVFMYIPEGVKYPDGINPEASEPFETNIIDNTDIPKYLFDILGVDCDYYTNKLFVDVTNRGKYNSATGLFVFDGQNASVKKNTSYAFVGDKIVDLDGEIAFEIGGRFYVPQRLLDIIAGQEATENTVGVPIATNMNCYINEDGSPNASLVLNNLFVNRNLSGYIEFSAPENAKELGQISFGTLSGLEAKSVKIDIAELGINGCEFVYDVVLDDGESYSFKDEYMGSFFATYTDKPITIDGVIDDEWANARSIVLNDASQLKDEENWKGIRDLGATFAVMYDNENLYFNTTVSDEVFCQDAKESQMWKGDSVQFNVYHDFDGRFKNKEAGALYEGFTFGLLNGTPVAHRYKRSMRYIPMEVLNSETVDYELAIGQELIYTTYEFRISWNDLFGYEYSPSKGEALAFSLLINDNDGEGRRGGIVYGDGIWSTKNVNEFLPMYLSDENDESSVKTSDVKLYYNDKLLSQNLYPIVHEGRVFASATEFLYEIGMEYSFNEEKYTVAGSDLVIANNEPIGDTGMNSTIRINDYYLPIRAFCESIGKVVEWDDNERAVIIK